MATENTHPVLTQAQREALVELLYDAFLMLRSPGYEYYWKKPGDWNDIARVQATVDWAVAIGEALHNIPLHLFRSNFDFAFHRSVINCYVDKNPMLATFISRLDEIEAMGDNKLCSNSKAQQ